MNFLKAPIWNWETSALSGRRTPRALEEESPPPGMVSTQERRGSQLYIKGQVYPHFEQGGARG